LVRGRREVEIQLFAEPEEGEAGAVEAGAGAATGFPWEAAVGEVGVEGHRHEFHELSRTVIIREGDSGVMKGAVRAGTTEGSAATVGEMDGFAELAIDDEVGGDDADVADIAGDADVGADEIPMGAWLVGRCLF
jgi:hypothetical protein